MGWTVAGNCKFVFCLLVAAAALSARDARGQPVATQNPLTIHSAPAEASCDPPDDPGYAQPQPTFRDWLCEHSLCGLFSGWSTTSHETPWVDWQARPITVGAFAGAMVGGPLINDWVGTTSGFNGGWRFGWEIEPDWGMETRFAFASLPLYDTDLAKQALIALDNANGIAPNSPQQQQCANRNAEYFQGDLDFLYYPWRETRLRPYVFAGMGLTYVNFSDRLGQGYSVNCLSLPIGIGVKYLCAENLDVRFDLIDDIAMSNQHLETQNNLSFTAGLELRFGGSRKIYWPFDLSR